MEFQRPMPCKQSSTPKPGRLSTHRQKNWSRLTCLNCLAWTAENPKNPLPCLRRACDIIFRLGVVCCPRPPMAGSQSRPSAAEAHCSFWRHKRAYCSVGSAGAANSTATDKSGVKVHWTGLGQGQKKRSRWAEPQKLGNQDSMIGKHFMVNGQINKPQGKFRRKPKVIFACSSHAGVFNGLSSEHMQMILNLNPTSSTQTTGDVQRVRGEIPIPSKKSRTWLCRHALKSKIQHVFGFLQGILVSATLRITIHNRTWNPTCRGKESTELQTACTEQVLWPGRSNDPARIGRGKSNSTPLACVWGGRSGRQRGSCEDMFEVRLRYTEMTENWVPNCAWHFGKGEFR